MGPSRASKRVREDDTVVNFWSEDDDSGSYLSVKLQSGQPLKERGWPWIQMCVRGILGSKDKVDKANFLNDGRLLLKTKDSAQTEKLLKVCKFGDEACVIEKDEKLNQSRGTISAPDLMGLPEDEIVGWLSSFGVVAARRFTRRVGNHTEKTPIILLTFDRPTCPSRLEFDYVVYQVRQHIPNPLICLQCGKYGHMQARCQVEAVCLKCGEQKHEGTCSQTCIHCGDGTHDCLSRQCPKWKKEKAICEIKVTRDVSYAHARRLYDKENQTPNIRPFTTVVRGNSVSDTPSDPSLKAQVSTIEQKLDKMITLFDRFLQLQTGPGRSDVSAREENQRGQGTPVSGQPPTPAATAPRPSVQPNIDQDSEQQRPSEMMDSQALTISTMSHSDTAQDVPQNNPDTMDSQAVTGGSQESLFSMTGSPPSAVPDPEPLTEPLTDDWDTTSQQSARQSWNPQEPQCSEAKLTPECSKDRHRESSSPGGLGGLSDESVSPSPPIGLRRQGGSAGRGRRMPSLTRKPPAPT
ncbi:uncharacterized protein LOC122386694 [Amphibalanus amphitrite]|uniref:uncharacterized protein LOC122386694 n=1 Tax=Amphibalanus amphitrite TaxID=1232801 RepID=UPI001C915330|nr:uncharacterized protein LOC122386694 [Amphibalanus amphitrite]